MIHLQRQNNIGLPIKGFHLRRTVYDALTGKVIKEDCDETDNLITTNGYNLLAAVLIGESVIGFDAVGSGSTAAELDDPDLETPILPRRPVKYLSRAGNICNISTYYSPADNNGWWRESALCTALTGADTIINRAIYTNPFYKDNTKSVSNDWAITTVSG